MLGDKIEEVEKIMKIKTRGRGGDEHYTLYSV